MRIATWNVNSLKVRLGRVEDSLTEIGPDVLCLQETKLTDAAFPAMAFAALGYESVHHGEGRWNGVAILSKVGLEDAGVGFSGGDVDNGIGGGDEARLVSATCAGVRVASVYVPNGRSLDNEQYQAKLVWLRRLRVHLDTACDVTEPVVVCGDFNIAPQDRDVYDPAGFVGTTHTSDAERAALAELEAWGLHDVFRRHFVQDRLYSWWDYRAGNFHKHLGMRIDLVLASTLLAERSRWAFIDRNARKGKLPSDHAPLIVDFDV